MVNKDKWAEIYNPGNCFNVNSYDYNSLKKLDNRNQVKIQKNNQ